MQKIFGIGLSRTGTTSCCKVMQHLGFRAIHLPYSMQDIDKHTFSNDISVSSRFEALDKLYPGAKFIYTTRNVDDWVASLFRWFNLESREAWYHELPSEAVREWINEGDWKIYGRYTLDLPNITQKELIDAYDKHHQRVMSYFRERPSDLCVLDLTHAESLPFTRLIKFLEENKLVQIPQINTSRTHFRAQFKKGDKPAFPKRQDIPNPEPFEESAERQLKLATVWLRQGKMKQAAESYEKVLSIQPTNAKANIDLGGILMCQGRFEEAHLTYIRGLETNPNEAELHHGLINAFEKEDRLVEAFEYYKLKRKDNKKIDIGHEDILCCLVVRNEAVRLPFFISFYRSRGITKFFVIDNDSTDQTLSFLLNQTDIYTWRSAFSFNRANFGAAWFELLLRRYAVGHWCLIVDIDELLYFPACEEKDLFQLCRDLDQKDKRAFEALLLDMYSDKPIKDSLYTKGQNYLDICPYFDRQYYHRKQERGGPYHNQTSYFGGARQRVFCTTGDYYLSKVPLIKYGRDCVLSGGQHWTNLPNIHIAHESGCLLHFKCFSTFFNYVKQETQRKEHYGEGTQYEGYQKALAQNDSLTLYDENLSEKFQNSQQLVNIGIMRS